VKDKELTAIELAEIDKEHVWHPYSPIPSVYENLIIESAKGCILNLADGRELIDGMSSWWTAIHGYNHPTLNNAAVKQIRKISHVMFGGLTHEPAILLSKKLVEITPEKLEKVFLCDSGSISIEVAMKMALQYWKTINAKTKKTKFLTIKKGYHGDTLHAMSVCDPVSGMHTLFNDSLPKQIFIEQPQTTFGKSLNQEDTENLEQVFKEQHQTIAAMILEPIVQGAGGMRFYSAEYLKKVRALCDQYEVLLICDEIATGFGRTGKLFASEHAGISPDIMCVGKALTGGYLTLAATITTNKIAETISNDGKSCLMHGPTFMGNPLACSIALASVELLLESDWQDKVLSIEETLKKELTKCTDYKKVEEVRCLGAIGVIQVKNGVDVRKLQEKIVSQGVWLRPFRNLIYTMPPYIIDKVGLEKICNAINNALRE